MSAATADAAVQERFSWGQHVHRWFMMFGDRTWRCEDWPRCRVMFIEGTVC